jgi:hypothetical protein
MLCEKNEYNYNYELSGSVVTGHPCLQSLTTKALVMRMSGVNREDLEEGSIHDKVRE